MMTNVLAERSECQWILCRDMPATLVELHFLGTHRRNRERKMFHPRMCGSESFVNELPVICNLFMVSKAYL